MRLFQPFALLIARLFRSWRNLLLENLALRQQFLTFNEETQSVDSVTRERIP